MKTYILRLFLFLLTLCGFFFRSRMVFAEPEPLPVMLIIDTSALENNTVYADTPKLIQKNFSERAREALVREGLSWGSDGEEATMVIKVRGEDRKKFSYAMKMSLTYRRTPIDPPIEPFVCEGCSEDMVVDAILERFPIAAKKLLEARENAKIQSSTISNTANPIQNQETCVPSKPPACEHQEIPHLPDLKKKYRPFFITGGVIAGIGGGLVVTGAILLAKGDMETRDPDDPRLIHRKNFRTAGIGALTGVGATMAITGAAILVCTHLRRKSESSKRLSIYPFFHPQALGMGISSRF